MPARDFSGADVVKVPRSFGYRPVERSGSHVKLRYEHPTDDDVRVVSVPIHDSIRTGTLQNITDQCGAEDFQAWCEWIDDHR